MRRVSYLKSCVSCSSSQQKRRLQIETWRRDTSTKQQIPGLTPVATNHKPPHCCCSASSFVAVVCSHVLISPDTTRAPLPLLQEKKKKEHSSHDQKKNKYDLAWKKRLSHYFFAPSFSNKDSDIWPWLYFSSSNNKLSIHSVYTHPPPTILRGRPL